MRGLGFRNQGMGGTWGLGRRVESLGGKGRMEEEGGGFGLQGEESCPCASCPRMHACPHVCMHARVCIRACVCMHACTQPHLDGLCGEEGGQLGAEADVLDS